MQHSNFGTIQVLCETLTQNSSDCSMHQTNFQDSISSNFKYLALIFDIFY